MTSLTDFKLILAAAERANAAYTEDATSAALQFQNLGQMFIGQYQNQDHQAVLSRDSQGAVYLSISGTRFSQGAFADLLDDAFTVAVSVGAPHVGMKATEGAYHGLDVMWDWALSMVPAATVFNVEGHSLGGWRTLYTPLFLDPKRIGQLVTFEAPKGANAKYWEFYADIFKSAINVVNGADIFYGYPHLGEWVHANQEVLWLHKTGYEVITPSQWPLGLWEPDHSLTTIIQRLIALNN